MKPFENLTGNHLGQFWRLYRWLYSKRLHRYIRYKKRLDISLYPISNLSSTKRWYSCKYRNNRQPVCSSGWNSMVSTRSSVCGCYGTGVLLEEWGYPADNCNCRHLLRWTRHENSRLQRVDQKEPMVTLVDQEDDSAKRLLADNFEGSSYARLTDIWLLDIEEFKQLDTEKQVLATLIVCNMKGFYFSHDRAPLAVEPSSYSDESRNARGATTI